MKLRDVITGLSIAVLGFVGGVAAAVYGIFKVAGKTDVLSDVTIPGIKRTITDTVSAFVERAVFGKEQRSPRYINYGKGYNSRSKITPTMEVLENQTINIIYDTEIGARDLRTWITTHLNKHVGYGYMSCLELSLHIKKYSGVMLAMLTSPADGWSETDIEDIVVAGPYLPGNQWRVVLPAPHRI